MEEMKMNKSKIVSMLLLIIFFVSNISVYAISSDLTNDKTTNVNYVIDNGHGEFKLVNSNIRKINTDSNNKNVKIKKIDIDLYEIVDTDVLKENKDYDKLIRVKEDTLLRVKEIQLDLTNSNQVEKIVAKYDINPEMAKDIKSLSLLAQQKDSTVDDTLVIYTPKFPNIDDDSSISTLGLGYQARYYYTGYLGYEYMDEIWFGKTNPYYGLVRKGYTTNDYFNDIINNFVDFLIGGYVDTQTGGAYSIAEIFVGSPVVNYPATSGDIWEARSHESKWRKYTSIDLGDLDGYNTRAVSERSKQQFYHHININGVSDYRYDPLKSYEAENYYDTDVLAYRYRDMTYREGISGYWINRWTHFDSLQ